MLAPWFRPFPGGRSHPLAERSLLLCSSVEIASAAGPPDCFRNEKPAPCPCTNLQMYIHRVYTHFSGSSRVALGGRRRPARPGSLERGARCLFQQTALL